jgi:hypothetical protein
MVALGIGGAVFYMAHESETVGAISMHLAKMVIGCGAEFLAERHDEFRQQRDTALQRKAEVMSYLRPFGGRGFIRWLCGAGSFHGPFFRRMKRCMVVETFNTKLVWQVPIRRSQEIGHPRSRVVREPALKP